MRKWNPAETRLQFQRPQVGDVVAFAYTAWRVEHVADAVPSDDEERELAAYTPRFRQGRAPYRLSLRRLHGPAHPDEQRRFPGIFAGRAGLHTIWLVYKHPGRIPLCSCCQHPWPCRAQLAEEAAADQAAQVEELSSRVDLGACFGCGDLITQRQERIVYPDANVVVPLAPGPVFHARQACRRHVVEYERKRAKATPDAAPMVDVNTHAVLRTNDGALVEHDPESYHAAYYRAVALDGIEKEQRRWASDDGRRDMWLSNRRGRCGYCRVRPVTHVGGNRAMGLTSGCRKCMARWVEVGYAGMRQAVP